MKLHEALLNGELIFCREESKTFQLTISFIFLLLPAFISGYNGVNFVRLV